MRSFLFYKMFFLIYCVSNWHLFYSSNNFVTEVVRWDLFLLLLVINLVFLPCTQPSHPSPVHSLTLEVEGTILIYWWFLLFRSYRYIRTGNFYSSMYTFFHVYQLTGIETTCPNLHFSLPRTPSTKDNTERF